MQGQTDGDETSVPLKWCNHFGRRRSAAVGGRTVAVLAAVTGVLLASAPGAHAAIVTLRPTADTFVDSAEPGRANGKARSLVLSSSPVRRAYLRFDLRTLAGPIQRATLRLYVNGRSGGRVAVRGLAPRATWSEGRTTFSKSPAPKGATVRSKRARGRGWVSVGITSRIAGGRLADLVLLGSPAAAVGSRESAHPPQLRVTTADAPVFAPGPVAPPPIVPPAAPVAGTPSVELNGPATADEGQVLAYVYSLAGTGSGATVTEDCGDDGRAVGDQAAGSFDCAFPDGPAASTVAVSATSGTATGRDELEVTVANVVPKVVLTGADSADEGQTKTYSYSVSDPGQDPDPELTEDCGANAAYIATPALHSFQCRFTDGPAASAVSVAADDGDDVGRDELAVDVRNVAPAVALSGPASVDEGQTKTFTYTITDPGDDPSPAVIEACGAKAQKVVTPAADSFDCTFPDGPDTSTVTVSADDGDAADHVGTASSTVSIAGVAPKLTLAPGNDLGADEGTTHSYAYTLDDPGADTIAAVETSCGQNGSVVGGSASHSGTGGSFACRFPDGPATSSVSAAATDSDGEKGAAASQLVTVRNVAPTVLLTGPSATDEGRTETYTYEVSDPGDDPAPVITEDCGAGGDRTDTPAARSFECAFPHGPVTSIVTVSADDGSEIGTDRIDVAVGDVATTIVLSGPATADEGQTKTYTYTVSDPGLSTEPAVTEDCGPKGNRTDTPEAHSFQCSFPDGPATSAVTATAGAAADRIDVTVRNLAPIVVLSGPASAQEGQTKTYTYTVSDPGQDPAPSVTEDCGANGQLLITAAASSFDCRFPDGPAGSTVKVTADDGDPSEHIGSSSRAVSISGVAPSTTLAAANDTTVDEGSTHTYSYTITDPGADTVASVQTSCGAGGTKVADSDVHGDTAGSFRCLFPDGPATSAVTASAVDSDGDASGAATQSVTVRNVAPTVVLDGPAAAFEGQTKTYTYSVTDPGQDPSSPTEACGTNGDKTDTAPAGSFECTFPDGPTTSTVRVSADDGDAVSGDDLQVTVANVAPTVTVTGETSADEGQTKTYTYVVSDPGRDPNPETIEECGTGASRTDTPAANSFDCTFPDGPVKYQVSVTADDGDPVDGTSSRRPLVDVGNVAPAVTAPAGQDAVAGASTTFTLGSFSDRYVGDGPWSIEVDWGDGSEDTTFPAASLGGLGTRDHTYAKGGTYPVSTTVTDKDGGDGTGTFEVEVASATLTIVQDSLPGGGQDFAYEAGDLPGFTLDDDADPEHPDRRTLRLSASDLGRRTITQAHVAGWSLARITCDDPDATVALDARSVTIDLAEGDAVECTFADRKDATLTVVQQSRPESDQGFRFAVSGSATPEFTLHDAVGSDPGDRATMTFSGSGFGPVTVTQDPVAGWPVTEIACTGDAGSSTSLAQRSAQLGVDPGEQIECTFVNRANATPIPGIFAETSSYVGPFVDGGGDLYTITEDSFAEDKLAMRKSPDGGVTWAEVGAASRPTVEDMESIWMVQDGTRLHMLHQRSGYNAYYNSFDTSSATAAPDSWHETNETVLGPTSGPEDQSTSLVVRSDGTAVAFYQVSLTQHAYKVRSAAGVWSPQTIVDGTAGQKFSQIQVAKASASDRIHIVYKNSTDQTIMYRTLDEANVLSQVRTLATGVSSRIHALGNHGIVVTSQAGRERVYVAWTRADKRLVGTAIDDGVQGPVQVISAHPVYEDPDNVASNAPVFSLAAGAGGDVYAAYSDGPSDTTGEHDLWYAARSPAGTWSTPVKALDGTDVMAISANVFTHSAANGGTKVLGMVFDRDTGVNNDGAVYYAEVPLPPG